MLYVLVEDRGRLPIAGIDRQFWRAFLEVNGRMTVLSVLGFSNGGVGAAAEALDQLAALAAAIRRGQPAGLTAANSRRAGPGRGAEYRRPRA